ncbi:MAG: LapA family protein [Calditrichia bacterium]
MKILGTVIKILLLVLLIYFLLMNSNQVVELKVFTLYYPAVNLSIVLLITLGIGSILGAVMMGFTIIQMRSEIRALERRNRELTRELENLRNVSIEEIPDDDVIKPADHRQ